MNLFSIDHISISSLLPPHVTFPPHVTPPAHSGPPRHPLTPPLALPCPNRALQSITHVFAYSEKNALRNDRRTNGWTDGWTDGRTGTHIEMQGRI